MAKKKAKHEIKVKGYFRKIPGSKKRIRVKAHSRRSHLPKRVKGRQHVPVVPKKRKSAPKAPLSKKIARKLPPRPRLKPKPKALPKPKPIKRAPAWVQISQYIDSLRRQYDNLVVVDEIRRVRDIPSGSHYIRLQDKLVWEKPLDIYKKQFIVVVEVWALVYDEKEDEHKLFSRTRAFGLRSEFYESQKPGRERRRVIPSPNTWEELLKYRDDMFADLSDWIKDRDYEQIKGLVAWTYWPALQFAPRRDKAHESQKQKRKKPKR